MFSKNVLQLVDEITLKYGDDIPKAVEESEKRIRRLPEFNDLINELLHKAIVTLVYESRGKRNHRVKTENRDYYKPSKVDVLESKSMVEVSETMYDWHIGRSRLGSLLGSELTDAADQQRRQGNGHIQLAKLLTRIKPMVPADKEVRKCVSLNRLQKIWSSIEGKSGEHAA